MNEEIDDNFICGICLRMINLPIKLDNCTHILCQMCIDNLSNKYGCNRCPFCR